MTMTGKVALQLLESIALAVDAAGTGEMRGTKALMKLNALGFDVQPTETPVIALVPATGLTAEDGARVAAKQMAAE